MTMFLVWICLIDVTHWPRPLQSVLSQIQHILNDKERLIKRSQLKRSEYKIFGSVSSELSGPKDESNGDAHLSEYHTDIYDDDDFYQELLKELIESRMADTGEMLFLIIGRMCIHYISRWSGAPWSETGGSETATKVQEATRRWPAGFQRP